LKVNYEKLSGTGLYDPGANISAISIRALQKIKNYKYVPIKSTFRTMSGKGVLLGVTILNITINNVSHRSLLYVFSNEKVNYDFIIGLDFIYKFGLSSLSIEDVSNLRCSPISSSYANVINSTDNVGKISETSDIWNDYMSFKTFSEKISHLDPVKQRKISDLITNNHFIFGKSKFDVGNVTKYECTINLSEDSYVAKKPYRCTFEDQQEIMSQCRDLLSNGIISQSTSPFASPVTLQFKKDGLSSVKEKKRLCVDFRDLNKITIPENYPFPLIDDLIVRTRGCLWFTALDINAAFHAISIRKSDRYKTAFITQHGHYEYNKLPFGLKISPAVFQRILSGILERRELTEFSVNYLDDILIFSRSFDEHLEHIHRLFSAIYEEGFRLNFNKCNFARSSIPYLGHILSPDSIQPLSDNLLAIKSFPVPSSRKNVRQFLGKINFYRKFIPDSVNLLEPFHHLLRKNVPFRWTPDCQGSFEKVIRLLSSSPILAIFDRTKPIFIYTDASGVGIGAVLKQEQSDGSRRPVAYFSKKLSRAQGKRKAIYIESLAIREAIRFWRFWLIGRRFTVITDHKPLQHLNLKARTDEELGDLANELLQFDFDVLYEPGSSNYEADSLSRNPVFPPSESSDPILPVFHFLSADEIKIFQRNVIKSPQDEEKDGILFRKVDNLPRIILDKDAGERLVHIVHCQFGHIGVKHILSVISKTFSFPGMYDTVRKCCRSCRTCLMNKTRRDKQSASMGMLGPASEPFEIMSLDTIGGFGENRSAYRYLHLLVDHFTRFAYILCTKGQSAAEMISLVDSVHKSHPIGMLMTDQYGGLSSAEFQKYCSDSNIQHVFVAVDCAFSNGLNERLNQTLVNRMRCAKHDPSCPKNQTWTSIAKNCVKQYNDTPHSVTRFSPSYLLSGINNSISPLSRCNSNLSADRQRALENTKRYHDYNKKRFDKNKSAVTFEVGDLVFVNNGNKLNRHKLDPVRTGPYVIEKRLSHNVFSVKIGRRPLCNRLYHASKLYLFEKCKAS
jgi:transposase InsO family protein